MHDEAVKKIRDLLGIPQPKPTGIPELDALQSYQDAEVDGVIRGWLLGGFLACCLDSFGPWDGGEA